MGRRAIRRACTPAASPGRRCRGLLFGWQCAIRQIPIGPGYQVQFAEQIRREAEIMTGAVGVITEPLQAEQILNAGQADLIIMAREMLRNPYWPLRAAAELGFTMSWPVQYLRAAPAGSPVRQPSGSLDAAMHPAGD